MSPSALVAVVCVPAWCPAMSWGQPSCRPVSRSREQCLSPHSFSWRGSHWQFSGQDAGASSDPKSAWLLQRNTTDWGSFNTRYFFSFSSFFYHQPLLSFLIFILYQSIADLQCHVSFRSTAQCFSYTYTCICSFSRSFPI